MIEAGASNEAQMFVRSKVAIWGGETYARHRKIKVAVALVLPADGSAIKGAFAYLSPLTALGMVAPMRSEGHRALVHTIAASEYPSRQYHVATRVCSSAAFDRGRDVLPFQPGEFETDLAAALRKANATRLFDATGGSVLASRIAPPHSNGGWLRD